MASTFQPSLQKAGSVNISEIKLISADNVVVDLIDFLVELNIYEDIFSNFNKKGHRYIINKFI